MNKQEWNVFIAWGISIFENWSPSQATSAVWYEELKEFSFIEIKRAIEQLMCNNPSRFMPGVFEIKACLKPKQSHEQVDALWDRILRLCARGETNIASFDQAAQKAIRAVGGMQYLGYAPHEQLPWIKKDFVRAYEEFCNAQDSNPVAHLQIENEEIKTLVGNVTKRLK